jgi:hypothetical protein
LRLSNFLTVERYVRFARPHEISEIATQRGARVWSVNREKYLARQHRYNVSEKGRERYARYRWAHPDRILITNIRYQAKQRLARREALAFFSA